MDEDQSDVIQDSDENCSNKIKIDSSLPTHKDEDLVTSESILSRINEACNKISSAENENLGKDSELSDVEGISSKESKKPTVNCNGADSNNKVSIDSTSNLTENEMELSNENGTTAEMETEENINTTITAETKDSDEEIEENINDVSEVETKDSEIESKDETKSSDMEVEEIVTATTTTEKMVSDLEAKETTDSISESSIENIENKNEEESELISDDKADDNDDTESDKNETGKLKIKLRSFASLCDNDIQSNDTSNSQDLFDASSNFEVSGVTVGDIVQHSNYVESDESGVMHLKISNVVGGEDCITGLSVDEGNDSLSNIQISSIISLIEPISPESRPEKLNSSSNTQEHSAVDVTETESQSIHKFSSGVEVTGLSNNAQVSEGLKEIGLETTVNIFKSPLVVAHACAICKKKVVCEFRLVSREKSENQISFVCSVKCKDNATSKLPENQIIQKPRIFFERICGMCGKDISTLSKSKTISWQTREFCNKLCLADHIGEVARACFYCKSNVRVLYMVKYCVRFGSDVHQFCSNTCLETYKTTIKVCSFCQKNLNLVNKVISPSNKEYCSDKCLKRAQRRDIGQINYKEENDCTVCIKKVVNEYEFIYKNASTFLCSTPCLNVFKYVNQVKSVNCCLCCRLLNAEDTSTYFFNRKQLRVFCSESCLSVFVISARKIVTCHYCKVKKYNFDMIWSLTEEVGEYFCCSVCCLNLVENQSKNSSNPSTPALTDSKASVCDNTSSLQTTDASVSDAASASTPVLKNCNMCSKLEPAQFHMVMSDSTLRSFCSYVCATRYKCTFGFQVSGGIPLLESKEEVMKQVTSQTKASSETQTSKPMVTVAGNKLTSKFDLKDAKTLMRLFCPPHLSNKSTMCRPVQNTKGIQCKPHQWHKSSQTESDGTIESKAIIPVPIPVYVPTPMMMYSASTPVPLIIPVPVPIPVFIPTLEKTTMELEQKIKEVLEKSRLEMEPEEKENLLHSDEEKNKSLKSKQLPQSDDAEELENENVDSEVKEILKLEYSLNKFMIVSKTDHSDKTESGSLKRKLDSDSYMSPKRRKLDDDEADDENEEAEVLNLMVGLSVWQSWVQRKISEDSEANQSLQQDLCSMSSEVLSENLIQFLNDLSKQTRRFDVDTIFYILLGLQKYVFEKGSSHCIFLEINFDSFTAVFDEMIEKFFQTLAQPCTKLLKGTRVTEEMLWEARQLGAHTPHVLINTLFYFNTKIFKLKSASDHFNLTFGQISKEGKRTSNSPDGSPVLTMFLKFCLDNSDEGGDSRHLEMYENKENPLRCPVKLYEFYLSKCPYSIQNNKEAYYVYPEESCLPDSVVWYTTKSIDESTITRMLNRVLLVKEVQEGLIDP